MPPVVRKTKPGAKGQQHEDENKGQTINCQGGTIQRIPPEGQAELSHPSGLGHAQAGKAERGDHRNDRGTGSTFLHPAEAGI